MAKVAKAVVGVILVVISPYVGGSTAALGYSLIVSNALDVVAQSLADRPRSRRLGQDIEYAGTVEPRRLVYGVQKVSGMNVIPPWTSGDKNQYLHQVLALTGHRVSSISTIYFNKDAVGSRSSITGALTDGKVTSGTYANKAWVRAYTGTSTQTADYILTTAFPSEWDSAHRGRGNAYLAIQYEFDDEVFQNGKPEVSCLVAGRICYDPRLDPTPGASPTNSAYTAFTTNPALCLADYLLNYIRGRGIASTKIDWDLVITAADICDEEVDIPGSTQARYTCNVVLEMPESDEADRENLKTLVGAMMGHAVFRAGKWRIHAGSAAAPSFELTADDLVGRMSLRTEVPANEKYNRVRGQFVDKAREYQLSEFEPRTDAAYESNDGGQFVREVIFPACDNQYEAQRNGTITLRRSRLKLELSGLWSMSAFRIRPWDVGTITLDAVGWDEKLVRCISWSFNQDGTINATFLEEDDATWDDPATGDYTASTAGSNPPGGPRTPASPTSINVVNQADGVLVRVEYPSTYIPGDRFRVYMHSAATPFSSAVVVVSQSIGNTPFVSLTDTSDHYFWVTLVSRFGQTESEEMPQGAGVKGHALSITTGFRLNIDRAGHVKQLVGTGTGTTTNTSTVTPIEAVGAPTYAWARVSGSTKLEPVSTTAATTGFRVKTGQTVANGATETTIFRCTATSAGASPGTATYDVTVTFRRDDALFS